MENTKNHLIFIGGLHRSGTSPLFQVLRENPAISGFRFPGDQSKEHEGQHLQTVYPNDRLLGGPGYFGFNSAAHLTETSDLVCQKNRRQLFDEWRPYWDLEKKYLLEKSPQNLLQMRFLQALFTDAVFVIILRHPLVVSLATWKWMGWPSYKLNHGKDGKTFAVRPSTPQDTKAFHSSAQLKAESMMFSLLKHWECCHAIMIDDLKFLKNFHVIRYEDFVKDPEATMKTLYSETGIAESKIPLCIDIQNRNDPYFERWLKLRDTVLSPEAVSFISKRFDDSLARFGYTFERPWFIQRSREIMNELRQ